MPNYFFYTIYITHINKNIKQRKVDYNMKFKGYELKIDSTWSGKAIVDIDVKPGVKVVRFTDGNNDESNVYNKLSYMRVNLEDSQKQFSDVERIEFKKCINDVVIPNGMFPNLKEIDVNDNNFFKADGLVLKRTNSFQDGYDICNVFGNQNVILDMDNIITVRKNALSGCTIKEFHNVTNNIKFQQYAFNDINNKGMQCIDGILVSIDDEADNIIIPEGVVIVNNDIDWKSLECVTFKDVNTLGLINNLPKKVIVDCDTVPPITDVLFGLRSNSHSCSEIEWNDNPVYKTIDGILYAGNKLIKCPGAKTGYVKIPDFVDEICTRAFSLCNIESVEIPDSVRIIREMAFAGCHKLKNVHIGSGIDKLMTDTFRSCQCLEEIDIPSNIKVIDGGVFSGGCTLKKIGLHEGLHEIGSEDAGTAIQVSTKEITLPKSLYSVHGRNFAGVKKINIPGTLPSGLLFSVISVEYGSDDDETPYFVEFNIKGKSVFVPGHINGECATQLQNNLCWIDIDYIDDNYINNLYKYSEMAEERYILAVHLYKNCGRKDLKDFLKVKSAAIAEYYMSQNEQKELAEFIHLGLMSEDALKDVQREAEKIGDATIIAYCVNELKKFSKCNKLNI